MSKRNGGVIDRIKSAWHSFRGGDKSDEEALSTFGLDFYKTKQLERRIDQLDDFSDYLQQTNLRLRGVDEKEEPVEDTPEQRMAFVQERLVGINKRIYTASIPWLTAGDPGWGAKAILAWNKIFTQVLTAVSSMQKLIKLGKEARELEEEEKKRKKKDEEKGQDAEEEVKEIEKTRREQYLEGLSSVNEDAIIDKVEYIFGNIYILYAGVMLALSYKAAHIVSDKMAVVQNPNIPGNRASYTLSDLESLIQSKDEMSNG